MGIKELLEKINIDMKNVDIFYNKFAKIENLDNVKKDSKLIVITSLNPTPAGEGKTSLLIGLVDAFCKNNKNAIGTLREPSLGPVFGMKGGASGGGCSYLKNGTEIDLHFTNDFHAITTANNLISTIIENEIFFDSKLNIDKDKILWKRCLDLNDRGLRDITIKIKKDIKYKTGFNITAASDLMALWCLVSNKEEFKDKLNDTVVAYSVTNNPIKIKDLEIGDAIIKILENNFKPNLVMTGESNPMLIHGGPFANIAHGCNSVIATKTALSMFEYVFTECGFGADLGLEKFMNIKMQRSNLYPSLIIICVTIKALKYHGNYDEAKNPISHGFKNLNVHINHAKKYNITPMIILNVNSQDTQEEIDEFKMIMKKNNINFQISNLYNQGSEESKFLVESIIKSIQTPQKTFLYNDQDSNIDKINKICNGAYNINDVRIPDDCLEFIGQEKLSDYSICMAKTQYSLTSDDKKLNFQTDGTIEIRSIEVNHAAKFIIPICGTIWKMPGLSLNPRAKNFK
ncbi:MAG: formate--tetrahydrofolate ligase [Mycoplasma sp.]